MNKGRVRRRHCWCLSTGVNHVFPCVKQAIPFTSDDTRQRKGYRKYLKYVSLNHRKVYLEHVCICVCGVIMSLSPSPPSVLHSLCKDLHHGVPFFWGVLQVIAVRATSANNAALSLCLRRQGCRGPCARGTAIVAIMADRWQETYFTCSVRVRNYPLSCFSSP